MIKKRDKPQCVISQLSDNKYLLKGTPKQEVIVDLVASQDYSYILIMVEDGDVRDLSGSILTVPGGYLVFKRLFEVSKRPAIYLTRDLAQSLLTSVKNKVEIHDGLVLIGGHELALGMGKRGHTPVGYISLPEGKRILHMPDVIEPCRSEQQNSVVPETTPKPSSPPESVSFPVPVIEKQEEEQIDSVQKIDQIPKKMLSIINAIASDERNLMLLKDIAYTAYTIISKVKRSGAASKEELAACVVAALTHPETRSRLRRIGNDIFQRFQELNRESGSIVKVTPGYRVMPNKEIILDEYPDKEMLESIRACMDSDVVKVHIHYDNSLGYPNDLFIPNGLDFGYISKNMFKLFARNHEESPVFTFFEKYKNTDVVYTGSRDHTFIVLIKDGERIYETGSEISPEIFGCCSANEKFQLLYKKQDGMIADFMPVCTDIYTIRKQYVICVLDTLPDKVFQVFDPHAEDIKSLVGKGYRIGTEKKGDRWLLWAFPAGKTLNIPGLPKTIVGGVPQY